MNLEQEGKDKAMGESETDEVLVIVVKETENAYQFMDSGTPTRIDWFPKSQVSFKRRNQITKQAVAEIPLWLLNKKGWNG